MSRPSQFEYITDRAALAMVMSSLSSVNMGWVGDISTKVDSDQESESYGWLGNVPGLSEFIGGRKIDELKEYSFSITNKDWQSAVRIQRKDMRRDKMGMVETRVSQIGPRVARHPAKLLSQLMMDGEASACYDGQYFFDTDHQDRDEGSQSNDITVTISDADVPTAADMTDGIMAAIQAMYAFVDDQGETVNEDAMSFMVQVPTPFLRPALEAVTALLAAGGGTNLLPAISDKFDIKVQVNPRLTSWTTKFAVFRTDGGVKPFILQEEYEPEPWALGPDSEHCIQTGECMYGADWGGNVGYGDWRAACLVTFAE